MIMTKMPLPFAQIDAFTDKPFSGNPAAVFVLDQPADAKWMQLVAREMNLAETAFLHRMEPESSSAFGLRWFTPAVDDCAPQSKPACDPGLSAAATAMPGVVFAGAYDGKLRAFDTANGRVLWQFDTNREFTTVGGGRGHGGSIEAAGPVVIDGAVLVNSGYLFGGRMPGNVLLKFKAH